MKNVIITSNLTEFENNNKIIVLGEEFKDSITLQNLDFKGKNNILVIHQQISFLSSSIQFKGSNSICYLNKTSNNLMKINLTLFNNSVYYQGKNNYFNGVLNCIISEGKHVLIGDNGMFSFGIWMRTSDAHLIYDLDRKKRINHAKHILLGSRVWIGQNATLLKGTMIGSGSVIGFGSITSKKISSNTINAGSPVREVRKNIIWDNTSTQLFTDKENDLYDTFKENESAIKNDFSELPDNTKKWEDLLNNLDTCDIEGKYQLLSSLNLESLVVKVQRKRKLFWKK